MKQLSSFRFGSTANITSRMSRAVVVCRGEAIYLGAISSTQAGLLWLLAVRLAAVCRGEAAVLGGHETAAEEEVTGSRAFLFSAWQNQHTCP